MIHRPTDSRLLTSLLSHEKEYTKQLSIVLEYSQASLASFSAYASASPPPASQVILAVAASLAGANEALEKYAASVDEWRVQLTHVKDLEGEVANVIRDREILVTRLLKAAKQQKPTRDSLTSLPGSASGKGEGSSKLNNAQSELQACETHLANKERELDAFRLSAIRAGLHARCKAMVECGWSWGEMGKEGIRALETLDSPNGHVTSQISTSPFKALPDPYQASSDLSSILPSHSASQIALVTPSGPTSINNNVASSSRLLDRPYSLEIPPAHAISDLALPSQYIVESRQDDDDSSSMHDSHGPVEVHENERFGTGRPFTIRRSKGTSLLNGHVHFTHNTKLPNGPPVRGKDKERNAPSSMFGSLTGLFHRSNSTKGRWQTRNVRDTKDESDSDDDDIKYLAIVNSRPTNGDAKYDNVPAGGRLKKTTINRVSTVDGSAFHLPYASTNSALVSDEHGLSSSQFKGKAKATVMDISDEFPANSKPIKSNQPRVTLTRRASSSHPNLPLTAGGPSLSRDSSLSKKSQMSSMSAPPSTNVIFRPGSTANAHLPTAPRRRATSATVSRASPPTRSNHNRSGSLGSGPVVLTPPQPNLMSIVEEAVRQNREARNLANPNNRLELAKAPISASAMLSREAEFTMAQIQPPPPLPRTPAPQSKLIASSTALAKSETRTEKRPRQLQQPKPVAAGPPTSELLSQVAHYTVSPYPSGGVLNKPLPAKLPLKSALRNPSRTPSPNPLTLNRSLVVSANHQPATPSPPLVSSPVSEDDTVSISSYVTVNESFDPEPENRPTPPPHDPRIMDDVATSDVSHSTSSTTTAGGTSAPARRKSVRMSLPPTYSTTPPAVDEWESEKEKFPWVSRAKEPDNGWTPRNGGTVEEDIWADSSDEDEEYSMAKRMLSKIARKGNH